MSSRIAKSHPAMTPGTRDDPRRPSAVEHWTEREIDESAFEDARLGRRFGELLKQIGDGMGESIPYACQDWANTKAAYRFFANGRVEEGDILSGHFAATRARCDASDGPTLYVQDTSDFSTEGERERRWRDQEHKQRSRQARTPASSYCLRDADAFELGGNGPGAAAGVGGRKILDAKEVQRNGGAKDQDQPD